MTTRKAAPAAPEAMAAPRDPTLEPAAPDAEGRIAVVIPHGGQVRRLDPVEAATLLDTDPDARRATVRDLAIAGVA